MIRSTNRRLAAISCVAVMTALAPAQAQQGPQVPVMVGDDVPIDAASCSLGQVTGLDPQGDNFLAVRGGPGTSHAQIDSLHQGDLVYACDGNGRWIGIVYRHGHSLDSGSGDCVVPAPVSPRQPYRGPCQSGWVFDAYVVTIAG